MWNLAPKESGVFCTVASDFRKIHGDASHPYFIYTYILSSNLLFLSNIPTSVSNFL